MLYCVCCVTNLTVYGNIFRYLDDACARHGFLHDLHEICMKATQTNMEESERDTERGNSKQEKDSDQPRQQNQEVTLKRGTTSVAWTWFGREKFDMEQKTVPCKLCRRPVPTTDSKRCKPLLPPTQESFQQSTDEDRPIKWPICGYEILVKCTALLISMHANAICDAAVIRRVFSCVSAHVRSGRTSHPVFSGLRLQSM